MEAVAVEIHQITLIAEDKQLKMEDLEAEERETQDMDLHQMVHGELQELVFLEKEIAELIQLEEVLVVAAVAVKDHLDLEFLEAAGLRIHLLA